jgi:hypothetical protein
MPNQACLIKNKCSFWRCIAWARVEGIREHPTSSRSRRLVNNLTIGPDARAPEECP